MNYINDFKMPDCLKKTVDFAKSENCQYVIGLTMGIGFPTLLTSITNRVTRPLFGTAYPPLALFKFRQAAVIRTILPIYFLQVAQQAGFIEACEKCLNSDLDPEIAQINAGEKKVKKVEKKEGTIEKIARIFSACAKNTVLFCGSRIVLSLVITRLYGQGAVQLLQIYQCSSPQMIAWYTVNQFILGLLFSAASELTGSYYFTNGLSMGSLTASYFFDRENKAPI